MYSPNLDNYPLKNITGFGLKSPASGFQSYSVASVASRLLQLYSAIKKNIFESVLMRWIKLELIIQSEVSQKDKHQYSILTHINGI